MSRHPGRIVPYVILALVGTLVLSCATASDDEEYAARMAKEHAGDSPVAGAAGAAAPEAAVETREVEYAVVDGAPVKGFLAVPADRPKGAPGIIVIQEWWGLNDNIRKMASRLAGRGYSALAVDLYRGRAATEPDEARALMMEAMGRQGELEENLRQAYSYLTGELGAPRVGAIGWCFGGGWALRTALLLPDQLDAVVIYYGQLVTDRDRLKTLEMPILGFFGSEDQGIPVESVHEFESILKELGKNATIRVYEGADHAFANPSGTRYQAGPAEDAWARTEAFFDEHLAPREG